MQYKANVIVRLKSDILDPQGKAILNSAHKLGYTSITGIRMGKVFEIIGSGDSFEKEVRDIASKLLANPVIEDYEIRIEND